VSDSRKSDISFDSVFFQLPGSIVRMLDTLYANGNGLKAIAASCLHILDNYSAHLLFYIVGFHRIVIQKIELHQLEVNVQS
jgi:hypothetical protein